MMIDTAITILTDHPFQVLLMGFILIQLVRGALVEGSAAPHALQNFARSAFSWPQALHATAASRIGCQRLSRPDDLRLRLEAAEFRIAGDHGDVEQVRGRRGKRIRIGDRMGGLQNCGGLDESAIHAP